ncbi:Gibberellin 3-beta-dioxygenase 1 [Ananas comosus]|uniref:gibberellin 3beta-dioxygenase n=1 Tax=Ananas comosus TaxID=4615 RepID=A0A199VHM6_ANACO|nr:Gibberellin 3-beta-dioxygenase 1 [Ananas comosus]
MPALSQSLHHFDLGSARDVPESHLWSDSADDHPVAGPADDAVPVVDVTAGDAAEVVGRACEEWGVFQATGHGLPAHLLDRVEAQIRRLFALPAHDKLRAARSLDNVSGYGLVPISSFFSKLMWSEGFTIAGSPLDHARKLWPHDHRSFCDVIEEYNKVMRDLAGRLLQLMLLSLGLAEEDVNWAGPTGEFGDMSTVIQLNSYPACPDPDRAMGLAAHTDSSLFTILFQNRVSGLQVLRPTGRAGPAQWVTVRPIPGAFVVNVGDLLHILSNGRFKSVVHRAVVNRTAHRVSAGFFCGPPHNIKVAPLEKLMEPTKGPAYRAVTWHEYLGLRRKLFDKALQSIKISEEKWEDNSNSSNNTNTNTNSSKASSVITCV